MTQVASCPVLTVKLWYGSTSANAATCITTSAHADCASNVKTLSTFASQSGTSLSGETITGISFGAVGYQWYQGDIQNANTSASGRLAPSVLKVVKTSGANQTGPVASCALTYTDYTATLTYVIPGLVGGGNPTNYNCKFRSGVTGGYASITNPTQSTGSGTTCTHTATTTGQYSYAVEPINTGGTGASFDCTGTNVSAFLKPSGAPAQPSPPTQGVQADYSATQIKVMWTGGSGTNTNYDVHTSSTATGTFAAVSVGGTVVGTAVTNAYLLVTGLSSSVNYFFIVRGNNSTVPGPFCAAVQLYASYYPLTPGTPTVTSSTATAVNISWVAPADNAG